ncbi:retrotransposon protein, putative, ty1-copia subclass [Tanacetum coccineum]
MPANQEHVHLAWPLWLDLRIIPTHVALNAINTHRLPLALLVYSLVRPLMTTTVELPFLEQPIPSMPVSPVGQISKSSAYDMLKEPKMLYAQLADQELFQTGLRGSRKLKLGALSLYVGDGHHAAVEAIGKFHLCLPSGLVLILRNCHYAPSITRGIISVSCLYKDGFVNRFENDNSISVSRNNLIYFDAIPRDDIYEIVLSSSNTNDSSMYAVSNKRAKLNLDYALLWHCHLGHISKNCIQKLQHDGLPIQLTSSLLKSVFPIMSRQGASYFVTFTDDFSRYGYVYLLKHKHEVFETFKLFQKEVENQLGKTIKSLRFDRGGEYMSQEFLDHLKEHRIIAHRTPPYTPQHNGVSERRNRTLLDMVRSMMSQTTLPKSFWDYALESDAHILNMVPTKKVDKTPYEVWHGQAPKLSIKCIFVGYPKETMGYSFYYPPENKVFVARNAEFLKNSLIAQEESGSLEDLEIIQEEDTHPSIDTSLNHEKDDQEIDEPQSDINPNYIRAIRILIAVVTFYDYEIWQMDVKTSFLNGYLNEDVYMEQPEGFVNQKFPNRVCKLKHSIYGLKQTSRQWNK